jgi:hypothetical protein
MGYMPTLERIEEDLTEAVDRQQTRIAFFAAYKMLEKVLEEYPFEKVPEFARTLGEGKSLDEACRKVFEVDYAGLLEKADLGDDITAHIGELPLPPTREKDGHGHTHDR